MTEKIIYLHDIDPIQLFGVNDNRMMTIKQSFPKLKIVARGHELKVFGDADEINRLDDKINRLMDFVLRHKSIHDLEFIQILHNESVNEKAATDDKDVVVYGNNGKVIKAKTKNQQSLIDSVEQNDLVFTIGPAGSGKTYMAIALAVRALLMLLPCMFYRYLQDL